MEEIILIDSEGTKIYVNTIEDHDWVEIGTTPCPAVLTKHQALELGKWLIKQAEEKTHARVSKIHHNRQTRYN